MQGRRNGSGPWIGVVMAVLALGCDEGTPPELPLSELPAELGSRFDPSAAGVVRGKLLWKGPSPTVPQFLSPHSPVLPPPHVDGFRHWPNPNAPIIDPESRGVAEAVVFLRGIDPERSRPWDHPPVVVEQEDYRMWVRQGETESRVGFVRRGSRIETIALDAVPYRLHASGAAFFTVAFVPEHPAHTRTLADSGQVEFSGAAGRYWMRSHLFVDEHPYYARTGRGGEFLLKDVPEGEYDLVAWLPNWRVADVDTDPNWSLATRIRFHPPVELIRRVRIHRGEMTTIILETSAEAFNR